MSLSISVYLDRRALPGPAAWAAAIRAAGFVLALDADFDFGTVGGFLPCVYQGRTFGFELACGAVYEDAPDGIGERDFEVSFSTSGVGNLITMWIAAAVLCELTDGVMHDHQSGALVAAADAIGEARNFEREVVAQHAEDPGVVAHLERAFASSLWPLLARVGFERSRPDEPDVGEAIVEARRSLGSRGYVSVSLRCDARTARDLRLRLYQHAHGGGPMALRVPWDERDASLELAGQEFFVERDRSRLDIAVACLAGAFAGVAEELAVALPELADDLHCALAEPAWREAAERGAALWRDRFLTGEPIDRVVVAKVVFVGARILLLDADGRRCAFKFDTSTFARDQPTAVSDWRKTTAGTEVATRLINGDRVWLFDHRGELRS